MKKQDLQKILPTLTDDITSIKEEKNKKGMLELSYPSQLEFELKESIKKDSKRAP